ncbi:MAG: hypothetical protein LBM78_01395 [Clostridiales bacterium]|jgi:hypothetical protein|nr:hypothetical protein [Clostridiales bacterium]
MKRGIMRLLAAMLAAMCLSGCSWLFAPKEKAVDPTPQKSPYDVEVAVREKRAVRRNDRINIDFYVYTWEYDESGDYPAGAAVTGSQLNYTDTAWDSLVGAALSDVAPPLDDEALPLDERYAGYEKLEQEITYYELDEYLITHTFTKWVVQYVKINAIYECVNELSEKNPLGTVSYSYAFLDAVDCRTDFYGNVTDIPMQNPVVNTCALRFEILIKATGEVLFTSALVPPGYEVAAQKLTKRYKSHTAPEAVILKITAVALDNESAVLATAAFDGSIRCPPLIY